MATDHKGFPVTVAEYSFKILEHYFHGKVALLVIPHILVIWSSNKLSPEGPATYWERVRHGE